VKKRTSASSLINELLNSLSAIMMYVELLKIQTESVLSCICPLICLTQCSLSPKAIKYFNKTSMSFLTHWWRMQRQSLHSHKKSNWNLRTLSR